MKTILTRREVLQSLAAGLAVSALPRTGLAADAVPAGGFRHSVCKWCYRDIPLAEFAAAVKQFGIESVELLNPADWPVVQQLGLTCAMANGTTTIPKGFNRLEHHAGYVPSMIERIKQCADAGIPSVIVFSGNRDGMPDEQGLENCVVGLKQIVGEAEKRGVTVCMELLNSRVNHKDYMCDRTEWGVELCKRVGSDRFKLLYDIYHMQIMEGDVIATIKRHHEYIAHYHTAGVPGRHELDENQELFYPAIVRAIIDTGYKGYLGQEFIPVGKDPLASLRHGVEVCDV
jgi:hydroxypyruvate isomerase